MGKALIFVDAALLRADKELFAVFQTIYSGADVEMWYDWNRRLGDTLWTDDCFFLTLEGKRIGGAVVTSEAILYPFLAPPFCDRMLFWKLLFSQAPRDQLNGILDADAAILPMFGYRLDHTRQIMCRPSDQMECHLPDSFLCRPLNFNLERMEIGQVLIDSYKGGICDEINGAATLAEAVEDAGRVLSIYACHDLSQVITHRETGRIAAVCLAGSGSDYTHGYTEIAELCVLPRYRGLGLAKYLISRAVTMSYGIAPFIKLMVHVGNEAEYLYRQMGFFAGPRFTNFHKIPDTAEHGI